MCAVAYLVTQPHHTTGGCNGDETTGNESLDADFLRRLGQRDLVLLLSRADTADDDIDLGQRLDQLLLACLQVAFPDGNTTILQSDNSGLVNGDRANEGDHLLHNRAPGLVRIDKRMIDSDSVQSLHLPAIHLR